MLFMPNMWLYIILYNMFQDKMIENTDEINRYFNRRELFRNKLIYPINTIVDI